MVRNSAGDRGSLLIRGMESPLSSHLTYRWYPRSRGVYAAVLRALSWAVGSSPLARGLPPTHPEGTEMDGIIPARAGFTPASRSGQSHHRNHPRSRGVYGLPHSRQAMGPESSPLARGLRRREAQYARESADHPCSRGVYYSPPTLTRDRYGSSPLARGLRMVGGAHLQAPGIIPARAGFTAPGPLGAVRSGDHPRSRGVYSSTPPRAQCGPGSSPLARGLRPCARRCRGPAGIIPARAGFTPPGTGR